MIMFIRLLVLSKDKRIKLFTQENVLKYYYKLP